MSDLGLAAYRLMTSSAAAAFSSRTCTVPCEAVSKVDALYVERLTPVMAGRLVAAGARLAALLRRAFQ